MLQLLRVFFYMCIQMIIKSDEVWCWQKFQNASYKMFLRNIWISNFYEKFSCTLFLLKNKTKIQITHTYSFPLSLSSKSHFVNLHSPFSSSVFLTKKKFLFLAKRYGRHDWHNSIHERDWCQTDRIDAEVQKVNSFFEIVNTAEFHLRWIRKRNEEESTIPQGGRLSTYFPRDA